MIHDKSTDIGYVAYRRDSLGNISVGVNERQQLNSGPPFLAVS